MASLIAHAAVGASCGLVAQPFIDRRREVAIRIVIWTSLVAMLPDADVVTHIWVKYNSFFGHRGFFHSPLFYLALSAIALWFFMPFALRKGRYSLLLITLFAAALSHSILDAMTTGGYGIMLYYPFSSERVFFDWRPIPVSPMSISAFFSEWGARVLRVELWFAIPTLVGGIAMNWLLRRFT